MAKQHVVNTPERVTIEATEGLVAANPTVVGRNADPHYVVRADLGDRGKVALVSGGGSGHEPLHTGFVGHGMLDAAVPGEVFTSPTPIQVLAAIRETDRGRGVLLLVKNYTGDVLNFRIAATQAAADGIDVRTVVIDDDLATEEAGDSESSRRGTAATVVVEKVCGAAAEEGWSLDALADLAQRIVAGSRTMALALAACTHPGEPTPSFDLPDGEIEFGVGIHGERGTERRRYAPARDLVGSLTEPVIDALDLRPEDRVIAIVNGLGSAHPLELHVVQRELARILDDRKIVPARVLVGSYVTALDMHGVSVTLVHADDEMLRLWDAPVRTSALTW